MGKPYNLEFILGLLNSKLFQWRFKKTSSNNNVSTTELESLPFATNSSLSHEIESLVEQTLANKINDTDTTYIEKQIDQLVYELYGLTTEEIELIENNVK